MLKLKHLDRTLAYVCRQCGAKWFAVGKTLEPQWTPKSQGCQDAMTPAQPQATTEPVAHHQV